MRITISGPPGSGKTTVAEIVSNRLSYELVTGGKIFRERAKEMNISLAQLGSEAEKDGRYDRMLDDFLLEILRGKENVIVESRLSGWLCHLNGIDAFKVFVDAREDVRLGRIRGSLHYRVGENGDNVLFQMREREESEWERYKKYYGIDYRDTSIYDLVVDSSNDSAEGVAEVIINGLDIRKGTGGKDH
ncbi:MAG: cytidylate kinase family protein [Candidatus Thermoplasmatota archaeon]|jgi:predicted cytidylate kinase|nr:cytidylate kinase family protein [Candidatus Thermoplasmatota archaeon]MCL5790219.1 cytidylate kinase family protein [Candidatus Thermoplasmatota archaeon]